MNPATTSDVRLAALKFHFVMVVWGAPYIDLMVNAALPTLLSSGNLPALADASHSEFIFYTAPADEEIIRAAPSVACLRELMPIRFEYIDPSEPVTKYALMGKAHGNAVRRARDEKAHAVVLAPDAIIADGSLRTLARLAHEGKRAVMTLGPRIAQETGFPAFQERCTGQTSSTITITPRDLVRFLMDHLHPEMQLYFVDSTRFSSYPVYCFWSMGDHGILARAFHLHPLMIDCSRIESLDALFRDTIDGQFIGNAIGRWSDIHVESDSDNLLVCTFSPADAQYSARKEGVMSIEKVRKIAYHRLVNPLQRMFFTHAIKMHCNDLDDDWARMEEATGLWAYEVLKMQYPERHHGALSRLTKRARKLKRSIFGRKPA